MKRATLLWITVFILCLTLQVKPVLAETVKVSLPGFPVTLNEVTVNNDYRQYPLIVYKDITYFPMTYYDCRFLGLETHWSTEKVLEIKSTGITGGYRDYLGKVKNKQTDTAVRVTFPVTINGKAIENSMEAYPLLTFRNVTYFPITREFGETFGWDCQFDPDKGLIIRSGNAVVHEVYLPGYHPKYGFTTGNGYFYYSGGDGKIYQTPGGKLEKPAEIYQLPKWTYGNGEFVRPGFYVENGKPCFSYHQGGAVMGSDHYFEIEPNGTCREKYSGYLTVKQFGDWSVTARQFGPPTSGNLSVQYREQEPKSVGDPAYVYGWSVIDGQSYSPSKDIYLMGKEIYILAFNPANGKNESRVHRVNMDTNQVTQMTTEAVDHFQMNTDSIYYLKEANLYRTGLQDGVTETVKTGVQSFCLLDKQVYYVDAQDSQLYKLGWEDSLNPGAKVKSLKIEDGYLICSFSSEKFIPYKLLIFNADGNLVWKGSDGIKDVILNQGVITYQSEEDGRFFSGKI